MRSSGATALRSMERAPSFYSGGSVVPVEFLNRRDQGTCGEWLTQEPIGVRTNWQRRAPRHEILNRRECVHAGARLYDLDSLQR